MKMKKILAAGIAATLAVTSLSAVASAAEQSLTFDMGVTTGSITVANVPLVFFTDNNAIKVADNADAVDEAVETAVATAIGADPGSLAAATALAAGAAHDYWVAYWTKLEEYRTAMWNEKNSTKVTEKAAAFTTLAEAVEKELLVTGGMSASLAATTAKAIVADSSHKDTQIAGADADTDGTVTDTEYTAAVVAAAGASVDTTVTAALTAYNAITTTPISDDDVKNAYGKNGTVVKGALEKAGRNTAEVLKIENEVRTAYDKIPVDSVLTTETGAIRVKTLTNGTGWYVSGATMIVTGRQNGSSTQTTVPYALTRRGDAASYANRDSYAFEIDLVNGAISTTTSGGYVNKSGTVNLNSYSAITGIEIQVTYQLDGITSASLYNDTNGLWGNQRNSIAGVYFANNATAAESAVNQIYTWGATMEPYANYVLQDTGTTNNYVATAATDANLIEIYRSLGNSIVSDAWYGSTAKSTTVGYPLLYKTDWYTTNPRVWAPDNVLRRDEIFLLSDTRAYSSLSAFRVDGAIGDSANRDSEATGVINNNVEGYDEIPERFAGLASQVAGFFNKHQNGKIEFTFSAQAAASSTQWLSGGIPSSQVGLRNYLGDATARDFVLFFNYANTTGELQAETSLDIDAGTVTFDISNVLEKLGGYTIGVIENIYYGMTKGVTSYGDAQITEAVAATDIAANFPAGFAIAGAGTDKMPALMVTQVKLSYDEDADVQSDADEDIEPEEEAPVDEDTDADVEPDALDEEDFDEDEDEADADEDYADEEDFDEDADEEDADEDEDFDEDEDAGDEDFDEDEDEEPTFEDEDEEDGEDIAPVDEEEDEDVSEPVDEAPEDVTPIDEEEDNTVSIDDETDGGAVAPNPTVVVEEAADENPGTGVALAVVPAIAAAAVLAVSKKRK